MSNIRKSFNFRNGVQVDEDNFIVNSNGLVGIGTSVPTEALDVRGVAKVVGLATVNSLFAQTGTVGVLTITTLNGGGLSVGTGIITSSSPTGFVTYYGDGGKLLNLPTSQWIDVDTGFGYTSIYAAGNVGVGTTYPDYTFQVGGTPGFKNGVGINSTGSIYLTGIITAGSHGIFGGSVIGLGIGSFATNLSAGGRLTVSAGATVGGGLTVGGGVTVGAGLTVKTFGYIGSDLVVGGGSTISGNVNIGQSANISNDLNVTNNATVGASATVNGGLVVGGGTTISDNLVVNGAGSIGGNVSIGGSLTVGYDVVTGFGASFGKNLVVGTSATVGGGLTVGGGTTIAHRLFVGRDINVGSSGTFGTNLFVSGITTLTGRLNVGSSAIIGNLEVNVNPNSLYLNSGDLTIGANGGDITISNNLGVVGILTVGGSLSASGGITGSNILVGVNSPNRLETTSGDLQVIVSSGNMTLQNNLSATGSISAGSNFNATGIGTIGKNLLVTGAIRGNNNLYVAGISTLVGYTYIPGGADSADIKIGTDVVNLINTNSSSSELQLDSYGGKVRTLNDFGVDGNFYVAGISSVNTLLPNSDLSAYLGSSSKRFNEAHIDDIKIGASGTSIIESVLGNLTFSSGGGSINFNDKISLGQIVLDDSLNSIGVGTATPIYPLDIVSSYTNVIGLRDVNTSRKLLLGFDGAAVSIVMGSNNLGSGNSVASITYNNSELLISNENFGNITSVLDNSTSPIGIGTTGKFIWKYGRSNTQIMTLDYSGNLIVSGIITSSNHIVSTAGTSSFVDVNVSGILTVGSSFYFGTGYASNAIYAKNIGLNTSIARSAVDMRYAGVTTSSRFMLPPFVTTTERTGLTTLAGAIVYNTDTNKHQGWNGTAWFDFY